MRRKVFDVLVSAGGLLVVAVLVVSGALLMWAQSFTNSSVHSQLAQQDIFFPAKADITPAQRPYLLKYAGQQVLTGEQANAYAQKIASDVAGMPYGGVYAKIRRGPPGQSGQRSAQSRGLDGLRRHDATGSAARGLCIRHLRDDRPLGRHRLVHPCGPDARPRRVRLLALQTGPRSRGDPGPRSYIAGPRGR